MNWVNGVLAILAKDIRSEVRTRAALNAVVLFVVVTLTVVSYSMGGFGLTPEVHASLIWVVVFFAAMAGLSRSFVSEAEKGTDLALRLSATGAQVYVGKFLFNLFLLALLNLILIPLVQVLLPIREVSWLPFCLGLALGGLALASSTTLVAAIVAQAGVKGALFTVLSFPILMPVLVAGVSSTRKALLQESLAASSSEIQLLVSYAGIMLTLSVLLFDYVWRE